MLQRSQYVATRIRVPGTATGCDASGRTAAAFPCVPAINAQRRPQRGAAGCPHDRPAEFQRACRVFLARQLRFTTQTCPTSYQGPRSRLNCLHPHCGDGARRVATVRVRTSGKLPAPGRRSVLAPCRTSTDRGSQNLRIRRNRQCRSPSRSGTAATRAPRHRRTTDTRRRIALRPPWHDHPRGGWPNRCRLAIRGPTRDRSRMARARIGNRRDL